MTTERLDEILKRAASRTPGPWTAWDRGIGYEVHGVDGVPINDNHRETFQRADAEFIANAPADVAYLLDLVRKQQAALAEAWSEGAHFGGLYPVVFQNDNPYRTETKL